jgi:hypothetical protein
LQWCRTGEVLASGAQHWAGSLSICTLTIPSSAASASARSAFTTSQGARLTRTSLSKKLTGVGVVSIELEIGRKTATEGAKTLQQLVAPWLACNPELPAAGDMYFDVVGFPEFERSDHGGRKADGKTVSPFGDPHVLSPR